MTTDPQAGSGRVPPDLDDERLDRVLQELLPEVTRTQLQRLIRDGHVRVNGAPTPKPGARIRAEDEIAWTIPCAEESHLEAEAIPLDVVFEDADLLVINKPKGLVVHPAPGHAGGTLVNAVLAHASEDLTGIGGEERPGIVHRLDKDTSGLMVVAKTEAAYHSLQGQIQARTAERKYLAVVRGAPRFEDAEVDAPIGRHPTDRKRMAVIRPGSSHTHREAVTQLKVLERFQGCALLEATLETGRTHQIRVHCAYIALPVLGDETYGPRKPPRPPEISPQAARAVGQLQGQALHAYRLSFNHPCTGERLEFISAVAPDTARLLDALGSSAAGH